MSQLSPALEVALAQPQATIFGAIQMKLPGRTVQVIVGSGVVKFVVDGVLETFTGKDDIVGVFAAIEQITDGIGDEAPALTITFMPEGEAAAAELASVEMQGSAVRLWLGAIDPQTGAVLGDPLLLFNGLLDVATLKAGSTARTVDYEVTSIFEDFFLSDDGARLCDAFHQYLWPGELGCSFVTYVTQQIYWGASSPDGVTR
ncbi:hypothetical protein [Sphingomonas sp. CROZ-RG-20F-R02-07]|uniref:hypothetical protein n=1 Tax=Sphingomonas sp. CROZ-RG-20F-R02-07 TaxID=2914832 RepID=UPI001F59B9F2|nr:hypothetical protein [Sphingomonas sp. CROZ-RG-20F-R02-07]